MRSLLFVSRPFFSSRDRDIILDDIRAEAITRNSMLDITGLLISTQDFFMGLLEGPGSSVDSLMTSICLDPRHREVRTVWDREQQLSRFPHWRMARSNGAGFDSYSLEPLLAACHAGNDPDAITRLGLLIEVIARSTTRRGS